MAPLAQPAELGIRSSKDVVAAALRPAGRRILDIGAGGGALLAWLARAGAEVLGVDPSLPALQAAAARAPGRCLGAAAERLPLAARCVDAALFFNSLHHVAPQSQVAALAEAARVLRPGGDLLVVEPLAAGSYFELLRPLDDESRVRAAALDALAAVRGRWLHEVAEARYVTELDYPDVAAVIAAFTAADAARRDALADALPEITRRFAALGRPQPDGRRRFVQPMSLLHLRKLSE